MAELEKKVVEPNWESFGETKQIKRVCADSVVVIAPNGFDKTVVPLFCPLCKFPMTTKEDALMYKQSGVCEQCTYKWSNISESKRKSLDFYASKEWSEYCNQRLLLLKPIINIK